jgi:hypothetical protein
MIARATGDVARARVVIGPGMPVALSNTVLGARALRLVVHEAGKVSSVPAMRSAGATLASPPDCTIIPWMSTSTSTCEPTSTAARTLRAPGVLADGDHFVELERACAQRVEDIRLVMSLVRLAGST